MDPDEQVREVIRLIFDKYDEIGTVWGVFHYLVRNNIRLGIRPHHGPNRGNLEFVESTVNQVISKRLVQKQQMRWTERGAHLLLQVRTQVLNEDLRATFHRWYPGMKADPGQAKEPAAWHPVCPGLRYGRTNWRAPRRIRGGQVFSLDIGLASLNMTFVPFVNSRFLIKNKSTASGGETPNAAEPQPRRIVARARRTLRDS